MVKTKSEIKNIIKEYKIVLKNSGIEAEKILLYGSYASGKANIWSDIDLVIVSKSFGKRNTIDRMEFLSKKAAEVDDSLEVLGYTSDEFRKAKNSIFANILSESLSF